MKKFRPCPSVNTDRETVKICLDLDITSREKLINALSTLKDYYFESDYDGGVYLVSSRPETDEEMDERISKETQAQEVWQEEYASWLATQEEERKKKIAEKETKNEKYKDPEYIEFLRMQAKMKEKGYLQ